MAGIADFVMNHGKVWAFCSAFTIVFIVATAAAFLFTYALLVVFGAATLNSAISGAISGAVGCGIGSALISATVCAIHA